MKRHMNESTEEILYRHRLMLCRLAYTYTRTVSDAEDIVQDLFVYVLTKKPDFTDAEHQKAWLIRSTIHRSINFVKKRGREQKALEQLRQTTPIGSQAYAPADHTVLDALDRLPARYKGILYMYYYEDYDQEEISCILDLPLGTVKTRMARGRKRLKEILKEEFHYER